MLAFAALLAIHAGLAGEYSSLYPEKISILEKELFSTGSCL
jgi:hypothetical protein